jgi:hypothetical protein
MPVGEKYLMVFLPGGHPACNLTPVRAILEYCGSVLRGVHLLVMATNAFPPFSPMTPFTAVCPPMYPLRICSAYCCQQVATPLLQQRAAGAGNSSHSYRPASFSQTGHS